jgi:opacity protein-like surface antigen
MRKLVSIFAVLSFVSAAHAESTFTERLKEGSDTVRLLLGSSQGSTNVGLDYERRAGAGGLGVFLLQTSKRTVASVPVGVVSAVNSRPETWTLGFTTPLHLVDKSNFDLYIAPGLTVMSAKDITTTAGDTKDVVSFGPALKIGTMYYFTNNWSAGLDFMTLTNWFSDRVSGQESYANFALGYTF